MRNLLRNLILVPTAMTAALAATAAMAETTLKVPFSFTVAGKNCPAGVYSVSESNIGSFVTLKSRDNPMSFTWAVGPGDPLPLDTRVVLQFDALGETHNLHSIQYGPRITGKLDANSKQSERVYVRMPEGQ